MSTMVNPRRRTAFALSLHVFCYILKNGDSFPQVATNPFRSFRNRRRTRLCVGTYGRGAEIWPDCNEDPIRLKDSFPGGIIPGVAAERMRLARGQEPPAAIMDDAPARSSKRRRIIPRAIRRILRRAAAGAQHEESQLETDVVVKVDVVPGIIAFLLLARGLVVPMDLLLVTFMTGYLLILGQWAKLLRTDDVTPILPSLPLQGHVPALVSNPLGQRFTDSNEYELWLSVGAFISLFAPLALLGRYLYGGAQAEACRACARPIFLLCCQAMSEGVSRMLMAPLPIRILVPVAYNVIRLGPLWQWALSSTPLGSIGRALAILNLAYWGMNLFGFLLPIATMRYLRAHFHCVEASEVTARPGMEASVGLVD